MNLKEKTALITGASSGIGREFSRQLAEKGMNLVITARSTEKLKEIAEKIEKEYDVNVKIFSADLTRPETPGEIFNFTKENNTPVHLLVNNAGFGKWSPFEEETCETYFEMNMLNVNAVVNMARLFLPQMAEIKSGGIINVASTAAFQPIPYSSVYAATKAYVRSFSLGLWQEYKGRGVIIHVLCPGYTQTGFQKVAGMPSVFEDKLISPEQVVKEDLESFLKGEPQYITKKHRDFMQFTLSKFLPLKLKLNITADMFKPE
ncbi:MAG: SDR family NAD(P)-dependent oxidoreductase [Vulcanimicrobiota bacterium]